MIFGYICVCVARKKMFLIHSKKCRSQHMNKASAMAVLQSRLEQLEIARQAQMNADHTQSLSEISWGNQIRSYVLHVSLFFLSYD